MSDRTDLSPDAMRKRALVVVGITMLIALAAWFGLNRAAAIGLARLDAYDRVRATCAARYAAARNAGDSTAVDESAISEVLDRGAESAPRRCVDLKTSGATLRK